MEHIFVFSCYRFCNLEEKLCFLRANAVICYGNRYFHISRSHRCYETGSGNCRNLLIRAFERNRKILLCNIFKLCSALVKKLIAELSCHILCKCCTLDLSSVDIENYALDPLGNRRKTNAIEIKLLVYARAVRCYGIFLKRGLIRIENHKIFSVILRLNLTDNRIPRCTGISKTVITDRLTRIHKRIYPTVIRSAVIFNEVNCRNRTVLNVF